VAWLRDQGVPIAHYGIEQFEELVKCAREQGDGAAAYWDQVRSAKASQLDFVLFHVRLDNTRLQKYVLAVSRT
jgi:hypothetical protein